MGGGIFMVENTGDIHQPVNPDQNSPTERTSPVEAYLPNEVVKPRSRHTPPIPVAGGAGEPLPTERDPFRDIVDPIFDDYKLQANEIIDRVNVRAGVGVNTSQYENFYRSIMDKTPPSNYTEDQRNQFYNQKQLLLSSLSRELRELFTPIRDETPERVDKRTRLIYAIENHDYNEIDKVIDSENPNSQASLFPFLVEDIVERFGNEENKDKSYMIDYLLEYAVERILRRADVSPKDAYPQFGFYEGINLDSVIATARIYDASIARQEAKGMFRYLSTLRFRRQIMHELFRAMKNRRDYATYITQHLRKEGLAFIEKEIAGVSDAKIQYEKFSGSALGFKKGWLTSDDHEAIDNEVRDFLLNNRESFKKDVKNAEGQVVGSRRLREWELTRAAIVGKSSYAAMQRRIVYTVLGDVPFEDIDTLLDSVDSEELARILALKKLIGLRFLGIDTNTRKIFIEEELIQTKKLAKVDGEAFGYTKADGTTKGLYNKEEDSWAILDTGVTDPQSNGWRGRKIFLKQKDYKTEGEAGKGLTIMEYLDQIKGEERDKIKNELTRRYPNKNKRQIDNIIDSPAYAERLGNDFNNRVRDAIQRQRLFLGPLLQMGGLNRDNKQIVWEKVAEFLPSRIAAFFPEETLEKIQEVYLFKPQANATKQQKEEARIRALEIWNGRPAKDGQPRRIGLKEKLFLAENKRVADDARALKGKTWGEIGAVKNLSDYYQDSGIGEPSMGLGEQDPEIRVIKELTNFVKKKAKETDSGGKIALELAKIKFPYTPFLDDVPKADWENIDDFSYDRILVYDHSDFDEGYKAIIGLIGQPVISPEDVVKVFATAKKKLESPLGLAKGKGGAQAVLEKDINAYLSMTRANGLAKLFGPLMQAGRIPRSKVEMGNLKANMAQNELFQGRILDGLAQQDVISDDPTEVDKNGKTQHRRTQEENDADLKNKFYFWARMLVAILGLELVLELFKSFLPPDFAKSFG